MFNFIFQELAGLGGDVRFFKNSLEYQQNVEVFKDVVSVGCFAQ